MEWLLGLLAIIVIFGLLAGGIPTMPHRGDTHINVSKSDREWWTNDNDDTYF